MSCDVKIVYFKSFQGYFWEFGYKFGEFKVLFFDDVVFKFVQWKKVGEEIMIYFFGLVVV